MIRRDALSQLLHVLGFGALAVVPAAAQTAAPHRKLNVLMRSSWGSDDPTRASFPFAHALALADAGHDVQIFLTGEATYLMRKSTTASIFAVGWPALVEMRDRIVAKRIPVFS